MSKLNESSKEIIIKILSYFMTNKIAGITYAEAIDEDTVAQLNVTITGDVNADKNIPAKRISLLSCEEEDKTMVKAILEFLSKENVTGFHYNLTIAEMDQTIHIKVELKQFTTLATNLTETILPSDGSSQE